MPVLQCHLEKSSVFIAKIPDHKDIYILIGKRETSEFPEPLAVITHLLELNIIRDYEHFSEFALNRRSSNTVIINIYVNTGL